MLSCKIASKYEQYFQVCDQINTAP